MSLELSRLQGLRYGPEGASVHVGDVPQQTAAHLQTAFRAVNLSRASYDKIRSRHSDLNDYDFLQVAFVLRHGLWISETKKPNCAIAVSSLPTSGIRYKAVVKRPVSGPELWLTAFHRINPRATAALLRRGEILRVYVP